MNMKKIAKKGKEIVLIFVVVFLCCGKTLNAQILFEDNFDGYSDSPENHGWGMSSNVSVTDTGGLNGSRGIVVTYNTSGTGPYWFGKNVNDEQLNNIYVRFYFKVHDPEYAGTEDAYYGGCKFLKIFGSHDGEGYANTTWGINYDNPIIREVSYGNGSGLKNDCQCVIRFAGSHTDLEVVVNTISSDYHLVDDEWHCFEAHFKYNTNGNRDGEYQVWIDGNTVVHATNVKNRYDLNAAYFNAIHFANYSHYNTHTWYLYYDDIVFADSYIGPIGDEISVDINNDGEVNIQDIQLCINVILGIQTNPEIVQKAKEVAEPNDICNELDVRGIINIILTQ